MKSSKNLIAFRTILIISLVLLVILAAGALTYPVFAKLNYVEYIKEFARLGAGMFLFPFKADSPYSVIFKNLYQGTYGINPLFISIAGYVLGGLGLILLVIGFILFIAKKKARYLFYLILVLVAVMYALALLGYGPNFFDAFFYYIKKVAGYEVLPAIIGLLVLVFAAIDFVLIIVNLFVLMGLTKEQPKEQLTDVTVFDNEEQPVMSEENIAPENVEEGEAPVEEVTTAPVVEEFNTTYVPELEPEPVEEEEITEEKEEPVVIAEPLPEPEDNNARTNHMEVNINTAPAQGPQGFDQNSFTAMIKDLLRDIVRDEIARNNASNKPVEKGEQTVTGATFGGPLVVQYFNGGINGVTPEARPEPKPEPKEEVKEEKKEEPAPAPEKKVEEKKEEPVPENKPEEKVEEPAPTPVPVPVPEPEEKEKVVYERLTFAERLLQSDKELHAIYNELKNEILSYGVKSRISANGDTFRLHKKMYVRITVAGKSLKLYFALNPDDYKDSKIPVQDAGNKGLYAEIPLVFKVRSPLSIKRAKELIQDCMDKDGLEQGEVGKVNWIKEIRAEVNESKKRKENKDEDDD